MGKYPTLKNKKINNPDRYGYTPGGVFAVGRSPLKHEAVLAAEVHLGLRCQQLPLSSQGVQARQEAVLPGVPAPGERIASSKPSKMEHLPNLLSSRIMIQTIVFIFQLGLCER